MKSHRRGAHAIEMALILPVMMMLITGIIEISWFMLARTAVRDVAQRSARAGSIVTSTDAVEAAVLDQSEVVIAAYHLEETSVVTNVEAGPPPVVVVTVDMPYAGLTGMLPVPETIHASARRMLEASE